MANNTQSFERTDRALADTFNENLVDPINVMVTEHNTHIADTALHMSTEENNKLAGIETGAEVNNISDLNAADLTDGTDTTLHTHATSGITGFAAAVRGMVLTGLSTATNAVITATDTILTALGKLQKQISDHLANVSNPHSVTKSQVGLGSVDNTADTAKPVSTAQATAIGLKIDKSVLTAAGDIIYATGAATPAKLAKGTARQQLAINAGATAPEWVASLQSLISASGDLIYGSAANTPAILAKGADGKVLTLASGLPSWATPGANIASGTYTGNGVYLTDRTVSLGFTPKQVFIEHVAGGGNIIAMSNIPGGVNGLTFGSTGTNYATATALNSRRPLITTNGFIITGNADLDLNYNTREYRYIAIG